MLLLNNLYLILLVLLVYCASEGGRSEPTQIENDLISHLGTKVAIQKDKKGKGKIHIEFYSESDLHRILDIISES